MRRRDLGCYLAVISHARPGNVPAMTAQAGPATWYVGGGEAVAYSEAGTPAAFESGPLCASRNAALRDAWAAGLPSHFKLHGREGKQIFKAALEPYVAKEILYRPKQGFAVPLAAWERVATGHRVVAARLVGWLHRVHSVEIRRQIAIRDEFRDAIAR